ncbi:hypothetical protein [Vibrio rotiferianus]|uniref:hypothetical protein n=1 Tax=Vibrio rotiferianus TaxID=190895 RepID=UPI0011109A7E|nr:hypothetical protein [Vibrio rotiferianus]
MKNIATILPIILLLSACAGSLANPYTAQNSAGQPSSVLCKNVGFLLFYNRNHDAYELISAIQKRGDISKGECQAYVRDGNNYARTMYQLSQSSS